MAHSDWVISRECNEDVIEKDEVSVQGNHMGNLRNRAGGDSVIIPVPEE